MADCVSIATLTIFSTPVVVDTVKRPITTVVTIPGEAETVYTTIVECVRRGTRLRRQGAEGDGGNDGTQSCPSGYKMTTRVYSTVVEVYANEETITITDDPIAIETQYELSCRTSFPLDELSHEYCDLQDELVLIMVFPVSCLKTFLTVLNFWPVEIDLKPTVRSGSPDAKPNSGPDSNPHFYSGTNAHSDFYTYTYAYTYIYNNTNTNTNSDPGPNARDFYFDVDSTYTHPRNPNQRARGHDAVEFNTPPGSLSNPEQISEPLIYFLKKKKAEEEDGEKTETQYSRYQEKKDDIDPDPELGEGVDILEIIYEPGHEYHSHHLGSDVGGGKSSGVGGGGAGAPDGAGGGSGGQGLPMTGTEGHGAHGPPVGPSGGGLESSAMGGGETGAN
ncbi:hypothetical protein FS837_005320, partial [Tulasnella sp. UAMH 9824]